MEAKQLLRIDQPNGTTKDRLSAQKHSSPYLYIDGEIPLDLPLNSYISIRRTPPPRIYSLGFQPAKTIPEIPRWFLRKYASRSYTVLDPFAGAGTTIIESLRYGASASWLDYHPLSRLICRVKTNHFSPTQILIETKQILKRAVREKPGAQTVDFSNKDFWFQKPVQEGLEILRKLIQNSIETVQPVLWLAFASTVRKCSNMNDAMLLAARRAHIEKIPQRSRSDVYTYFEIYVRKAAAALDEWNNEVDLSSVPVAEHHSQDARSIDGNGMCDAIVTSPPYVNAIDYVWASKFELHWLGLVKNNTERLELYSQEIGSERIPSAQYKELGWTGHPELDPLIEEIYLARKYQASKGQNALRARVVYQFFTAMKEHFVSSFLTIRPGGYYCFSVGDQSTICGVNLPIASLLADFAAEVGFHELFRFHLLLKNRKLNIPRTVAWAGTIKHDTVVVLQKPIAT